VGIRVDWIGVLLGVPGVLERGRSCHHVEHERENLFRISGFGIQGFGVRGSGFGFQGLVSWPEDHAAPGSRRSGFGSLIFGVRVSGFGLEKNLLAAGIPAVDLHFLLARLCRNSCHLPVQGLGIWELGCTIQGAELRV